MNWFKLLKTAEEIGHGDTLEGQYLKQQMMRLANEIDALKTAAMTGGPESVMPRWRGEIRQQILLLPPLTRLERLSLYELKELQAKIETIHQSMKRYSASRFMEIMGNASNNG